MPRIPRIVAPGLPHHLTARGNRRGDIFEDDTDRRVYLQQLHKYCAKARVLLANGKTREGVKLLKQVPKRADGYYELAQRFLAQAEGQAK